MSLSFALLVLNVCNVFALPKCPIEKKVPYHNCFGTYIFSNGDMYVGEFQNGKKTVKALIPSLRPATNT